MFHNLQFAHLFLLIFVNIRALGFPQSSETRLNLHNQLHQSEPLIWQGFPKTTQVDFCQVLDYLHLFYLNLNIKKSCFSPVSMMQNYETIRFQSE